MKSNKTTVLGITGPSGAGKSIFSAFLRDKGIPVADADEIYHALLVPPSACLDELTETFGKDVLTQDGELNRKALAAIVFADRNKLNTLNAITHRYVTEKMVKMLQDAERCGEPLFAADIPLLFESASDQTLGMTQTVAVLADRDIRIKRITERDGLTPEQAQKRIASQPDDGFYLAHATCVLYNNGDLPSFLAQAEALLHEVLSQ